MVLGLVSHSSDTAHLCHTRTDPFTNNARPRRVPPPFLSFLSFLPFLPRQLAEEGPGHLPPRVTGILDRSRCPVASRPHLQRPDSRHKTPFSFYTNTPLKYGSESVTSMKSRTAIRTEYLSFTHF